MNVDVWFRSPDYVGDCLFLSHVPEPLAARIVDALTSEMPEWKVWSE